MAERSCRRRGLVLAAAAGAVLATGLPAIAASRLWLTYNASPSAPVGLYLMAAKRPLRVGDVVLVRLPRDAAALAAERGYLPRSVPAVKRVAGLAGDRICGQGKLVLINAAPAAIRFPGDGKGRALPSWDGCRTLRPTEVFLLNEGASASFDGRYFGPVDAQSIIGRLVPLWTW
ncbi:S26 family signal peptidase [Inquilinus sp. Marseille-Q2685]|uniref:S26 family signal peptidase n=1 Tax=Inquilinus sp. Marseille-Q2685 TaxID=2866581 RepID=UPI001CE3F79F|nr:S26 family signal peptidase [Inquilinus sp. Marseille-Q2685]